MIDKYEARTPKRSVELNVVDCTASRRVTCSLCLPGLFVCFDGKESHSSDDSRCAEMKDVVRATVQE